MTAPDVKCFHIAIAVRDIDVAIEGYGRLLGTERWHILSRTPGTRVAYGVGSGMTWELWEATGEGTTQFHEFLRERGEGVQHIGFWTPDLKTSVEAAVANGAQLVSATTDDRGHSAVQLVPASGLQSKHLDALGITAFVDAGFGGWRIEYVGPTGERFLRDWLEQEYDHIIITKPPW
jgi:catechol 2,3-dioxygenase-like lactoylglutathione lyase family enzyme